MEILVVDDSKLARITLINILSEIEPSATCHQAQNGAIALELFKELHPRIVFLDLTMPVMDGYQLLEEIMKIDEDTQVVVVSADIQPQAKKKVLAGGAKSICSKPMTHEKMLSIFQNDLII